jgi:uncharacterized protein
MAGVSRGSAGGALHAALLVIAFATAGCERAPVLVDDGARLMSSEQAQRVQAFHRLLLKDHDIDYRVVTMGTPAVDINRRAVELFEELEVGTLSRGGRGLLLVLDTAGNRVRLEVGRALEAVYPDAFVGYVENRQMTPFFAAGRVADGILAATEMIMTRAQHATAHRAWDDEQWAQPSTAGGGATVDARLNAGADTAGAQPGGSMALAGDSPQATLRAYLRAMAAHDGDAALPVYSEATRAMLRQWVMTTAQMDNLVKAYRGCRPSETFVDPGGRRAVIRYPIDRRQCSPWFFVIEDGAWRLDLATQQKVVGFGRDNSWHLNPKASVGSPYRFAFDDWVFDGNGFPVRQR